MNKSFRSVVPALALLCLLTVLSAAVPAAPVSGIGTIDVQKVFRGYKETTKAQEQLSKEEAAFKKEFEESQKKIESARAAGKSEKELESMTKKLEETLAPKREKLMKMNETLTSSLQSDIVSAVKTVAKNLGIETVFDKQVVITGGVDISDMVISKLNEKK